jgi:tRNA G18 (ribose-2'-O)-methylase SpoU
MENPMVNYSKVIADTASAHYNVRDEYKDNTIEQNIEIQKAGSHKFSVGCVNVTGELNVGMMIRSACLFGADTFYIFGRKKFDKRSTVGAEKYINIVQYSYDDPMHADELISKTLWEFQSTGKHDVILCEQGGFEIKNNSGWGRIEDAHPNHHPLFLFGSESHGIPKAVTDINFNRVSIPQVGVLRSFNVASAMNIILWDYIKEVYL